MSDTTKKPDDGGLASEKSLRDEFAGQMMVCGFASEKLMPEICKTSASTGRSMLDILSETAYEQADYMIREKRKREQA